MIPHKTAIAIMRATRDAEQATAVQLAEAVGLTRQGVYLHLPDLLEAGLVEQDKRGAPYRVTAKGHGLLVVLDGLEATR